MTPFPVGREKTWRGIVKWVLNITRADEEFAAAIEEEGRDGNDGELYIKLPTSSISSLLHDIWNAVGADVAARRSEDAPFFIDNCIPDSVLEATRVPYRDLGVETTHGLLLARDRWTCLNNMLTEMSHRQETHREQVGWQEGNVAVFPEDMGWVRMAKRKFIFRIS